MSRIKAKDTGPEMLLRKRLFRDGLRYRVYYPVLGKPDIAFPSKKIAVFVHGCFWHSHGCSNDNNPESNTGYWKPKKRKNKLRDKKTVESLESSGWRVITVWECDITKDLDKAIMPIKETLMRK